MSSTQRNNSGSAAPPPPKHFLTGCAPASSPSERNLLGNGNGNGNRNCLGSSSKSTGGRGVPRGAAAVESWPCQGGKQRAGAGGGCQHPLQASPFLQCQQPVLGQEQAGGRRRGGKALPSARVSLAGSSTSAHGEGKSCLCAASNSNSAGSVCPKGWAASLQGPFCGWALSATVTGCWVSPCL